MAQNYHHQATIPRRNPSLIPTHHRREKANHAIRRSSSSSTRPIYVTNNSSSSAKKLHHVSVRRRRQPMFVMTRNMDMKKIEKLYECFTLDFNPYETTTTHVPKFHNSDKRGDICITAEKGKVALRDYPHPRHLCKRYPFDKTLHYKHCRLCHCYVCDVAAPCKLWWFHCSASDRYLHWKLWRQKTRSSN